MKIVNTEIPGVPCRNGDWHVLAVLTQDDAGLYAVYVGIVERAANDGHKKVRAEWVAHNGAKLTFEKSKAYFRGIEEKSYRH
jgi:hypothetical protein